MWAVTNQLATHRCLFRVDGSLLAPPIPPPTVCVRARVHALALSVLGGVGNWQMVRWEDLVGVGERLLHYFY